MKYREEHDAWLRGHYAEGSISDTVDAFEREFGWRPSRGGVSWRASVLGLRKASYGRRLEWTPERSEWFRAFVPGHEEREISAEHERLFGVPLTESQIAYGKTRLGVRSGTCGGRFEKGREPENKGKTWDEYMPPESQERCRATQFKPGEIHGDHVKPLGWERKDKDGFTYVKVKDGLQDHWNENFVQKHRVVYEQAHGAVPEGCNVVFADGDRTNLDPSNLVAVPRSLWARVNRMPYWDAESLEACIGVARLVGEARAKEKQRKGKEKP